MKKKNYSVMEEEYHADLACEPSPEQPRLSPPTMPAVLRGKDVLYRGCQLMHRRFKFIYYYDESEDIVHLVDIWDTKMDPKALIKRIK